jgi:septal ring factor EnvC (AmiA/AmiB activator)
MIRKLTFLLFLIISWNIASADIAESETQLAQLKNKLSETNNKLQQVKASLFSIEQEIGGKNNLYLENVKQLDQLSVNQKQIQSELDSHTAKYQEQQVQLNKMISSFIMRGLDDSDPKHMLERSALKTRISEVNINLKSMKKIIDEMQIQVMALNSQVATVKANEQSMAELIADLESKKQNFSQDYAATLENKNTLDKQFQTLKLEVKGRKIVQEKEDPSVAFSFMPPLKQYLDYRKDQKGVNFYYRETSNLHAPEKGQVVHVGDLGAYGTVVMIDHGQDIRSVLLGKIQYKVKKGSQVTRGEVLGYVTGDNNEKQNLYFEVRKNNQAQNSYAWLDKKLLVNNL